MSNQDTFSLRDLDLAAAWAERPDEMKRLLSSFREAVRAYYQTRKRHRIQEPDDVEPLVLDMAALEAEVLRVILLDIRLQIIGVEDVAQGTNGRINFRMADIFRTAVRKNADAIILAHNHPSGDPTPSPNDVHFTRQAIEAGSLLDIRVLDHFIVGGAKVLSLRRYKTLDWHIRFHD